MDRRQKLLDGIDVASLLGVEIGPLCFPLLRRTEGSVIYVDHATTEDLQKKYKNDPSVHVDEIVDVDAVWGQKTLREAVGRSVDYIVASHVVEHVPDLITWMEELHSVLAPGGEVRLIVPDRRFTFDYLRKETRIADVLYAYFIKARRPHPQLVLEFCLNTVKVDCHQAWRGTIDEGAFEHSHNVQRALDVAKMAADGTYVDVHCWVFTPKSFCELFAELVERGVMQFECTMFHDTSPDTIEFFIGMRPSNDTQAALRSWREAASRAQDFAITASAPGGQQEELRDYRKETKELEEALAESRAALDAMFRSTSWRLTAPLRRIKSLLVPHR